MKIRKTTEQDVERMMEIYAYAREQMAKTGNPNQWGPTGWPPEELIHHDIEEGNSYVCENDAGERTRECQNCHTIEKGEIIPISEASVSGLKAKTWTGKAQKQSPVVKLSGKTLKSGTAYTVTYKDNKNVGLATLTITGKDNYTGAIKKTFRINPKGTGLKKLKKGKKSITVKWKKQSARMSASRITGYQI